MEFCNVLATYVRSSALTLQQGSVLLARAEQLMRGVKTMPNAWSLQNTADYGISAYDGRFVAVAQDLGTKLITEDRKLRDAVPGWTMSLDDALV